MSMVIILNDCRFTHTHKKKNVPNNKNIDLCKNTKNFPFSAKYSVKKLLL